MYTESEIEDMYSTLVERLNDSSDEDRAEAEMTCKMFKIMASENALPKSLCDAIYLLKEEKKKFQEAAMAKAANEVKTANQSPSYDVFPVVNEATATGGFVTSDKIAAMGGMENVLSFIANHGVRKLVTEEDYKFADNEHKAMNAVLFGTNELISTKCVTAGSYLLSTTDTSEPVIMKRLYRIFDNQIYRDLPIEFATIWGTDIRHGSLEEALETLNPKGDIEDEFFHILEYGVGAYLPDQHQDQVEARLYTAVPTKDNGNLADVLRDKPNLEVEHVFQGKEGLLTVVQDTTKAGMKFGVKEVTKETAHKENYKTMCMKTALKDRRIANILVLMTNRLKSLGLPKSKQYTLWAIHNMILGAMSDLGYIKKRNEISPINQWLDATEKMDKIPNTIIINNLCKHLAKAIRHDYVALGIAASPKIDRDAAAAHAIRARDTILYIADFDYKDQHSEIAHEMTSDDCNNLVKVLEHAADCTGHCALLQSGNNVISKLIANAEAPPGIYSVDQAETLVDVGFTLNNGFYYVCELPTPNHGCVYGVAKDVKTAEKIALYYKENPGEFPRSEYYIHESQLMDEFPKKTTILEFIEKLSTDPMIIDTGFGPSIVSCANISTIPEYMSKDMREIEYSDLLAIVAQCKAKKGYISQCLDTKAILFTAEVENAVQSAKSIESPFEYEMMTPNNTVDVEPDKTSVGISDTIMN